MYQKHDADFSIRNFEKFTVPALRKCFGLDAQIFSTEGHTTDEAPSIEKALDFAGVDVVVVAYDGRTYFFSSRVQRGECRKSFTLRGTRPNGAVTEFAKLQYALQRHEPMPTYSIQAFVEADEQIATVAIARTIDLIRYVERNPEIRTTATGETFFVIPWSVLERVKVYLVHTDGQVGRLKP